ncbi:MAG: energy-coupling factor transporter transmembrane component T family protein [Anaerolineae bacterium]
MSVVFDIYVEGTSLLHRLDPRTKLWSVALSVAMVFLVPDVLVQTALLITVHLILLGARIPWSILGQLWRQMAVLVILILLLQPFFSPGGRVLLDLGALDLTTQGIETALEFALRALNIAFLVSGLLYTTPQPDLIRSLVRLGLPYTWGLTVSLSLRFLPAIQSIFHAVRDAQAARGWTPAGGLRRRVKEYIPVLVAVIIGTLRMTDQLTLALAARGFETMGNRTAWRKLEMRGRDWLILLLTTLAFAGVLWLRLAN